MTANSSLQHFLGKLNELTSRGGNSSFYDHSDPSCSCKNEVVGAQESPLLGIFLHFYGRWQTKGRINRHGVEKPMMKFRSFFDVRNIEIFAKNLLDTGFFLFIEKRAPKAGRVMMNCS